MKLEATALALSVLMTACGDDATPARDGGSARDGGPPSCLGDGECSDGVFCNGVERCVPDASGSTSMCVAGSGDPCAPTDTCDESQARCVPRCESGADIDADGHASLACGGGDCDDSNASVNPGGAEACNANDDDCDGVTDEASAAASCPAIAGTTFECRAATCEVAACEPTVDDCDHEAANGCETDLTSNRENCGMCGRTCFAACRESECDEYVELATSQFQTCGLLRSGRVACWGRGDAGGLGDGTVDSRASPGPVTGLSNAVAIGVGDLHSCAIRDTGRVACWGFNYGGSLGDGIADHGTTCTPSTGPVDCAPLLVDVADLVDAVEVVAGGSHTCVRRATGAVACWGVSAFVGDGLTHPLCEPSVVSGMADRVRCSMSPSHVAGIDDAVSIDGGGLLTCAVRSGGSVACWGLADAVMLGGAASADGTPIELEGLSDAISVSAGLHHTCVLRRSGSMMCWGYNIFGGFADGTTLSSSRPALSMLTPEATRLTTGHGFGCALSPGGQAMCWGSNALGQLGDGILDHGSGCGAFGEDCSLLPVNLPTVTDATRIAADLGGHACAIRASGETICWGWNLHGQLGDGTFGGSRGVPMPVLPLP